MNQPERSRDRQKTALRLTAGAAVPSPAEQQGFSQSYCIRFLYFAKFYFLQLDFESHRRKLPFYPIRFLTGNPARRCVVWLPLARSLKLKSWQASPKKYPIGRSFTFIPDTKMCLGYSDKPVDDIQSLSGKPVIIRTII